ncbi:hypothetical protein [Chryseolinea lacunae]|uniref:DUF4890 domain-containing protein n=1 Tax=Chryseolinea lacunae TaxID=2801331 RepID=A0ABS1KZ90_9BACT|nr:hypothetical protein [Chryseolinea lacunae]MBL0744744.1 hypothetical protein [Chryseolinea lacunae]
MRTRVMLIAAMLTSSVIFAQHKSSHMHHKGGDASETMKKVLSLNDTQYATIQGIDKKYAAKFSDLRNDSAQARDTKRTEFGKLKAARESEINGVLTPEQKTKWTTYKKEEASKHKARRQEHAEKNEARLKEQLSLSDEQFAKVQTTNKDFRTKFEAAHKDKKDKAEIEKLKTDHDAAMKAILTPQQFEKWNTMKADMKKKHGDRKPKK